MIKVQLKTRIERKTWMGHKPSRSEVVVLLNQDAKVLKPNGEPLCILRRGVASGEALERARPELEWLERYKTDNRGAYNGQKRVTTVFADGAISRSNRTRNYEGKAVSTASAIVGYFDRMGGRFPYCRATSFTAKEVDRWEAVSPLAHHVAELFREEMPERYAKQIEHASKCRPEWIIRGTPFSTMTVNNNVIGATHKDAGDYKEGFGIIAVARRGQYSGAWLTFPEFGVAADLQDGDLIYFNSHDWHGLTPFENTEDGYRRVSVVFYLREKMVNCGSPAEELENAKRARGAL